MNKIIPIVRDENGKPVNQYNWLEWIAKLDAKLNDLKFATYTLEDKLYDDIFDEDDGYHQVAEELQDLITIATSMQEGYLDFREPARDKICAEVNEKNRKRGYHSKINLEENL